MKVTFLSKKITNTITYPNVKKSINLKSNIDKELVLSP